MKNLSTFLEKHGNSAFLPEAIEDSISVHAFISREGKPPIHHSIVFIEDIENAITLAQEYAEGWMRMVCIYPDGKNFADDIHF